MGFGLPGWPGGDPAAISDVADAWDALASKMSDAIDTADKVVQSSFSQLDGQTKTTYLQIWGSYVKAQHNGVSGARTVAKNLRSVAKAIEDAHKKYEHIMEGLAVAAAAGIVVGFFTLGIGDAVADTAAVGVAAGAIATLLEGLGVTIAEEAVADVIGGMVADAVISVEFSVFMQEGESVGSGEGFKMVDISDTVVAGVTGAVTGGVLRSVDIAAEVEGLSGLVSGALKGLLGAGVNAGGTMLSSELDHKGAGDLTDVLLSALLGGAGGAIDQGLTSAERTVTSAETGQAKLALDFGALFKKDPELLTAIKDDPLQSDDVRYLAYQYKNLFDADPSILDDVPELGNLLDKNPQEITQVIKANKELTDIAKEQALPPSVKNLMLKDLAAGKEKIEVGVDGVSDFVKDWVKSHRELIEELEHETSESVR